MRIMLACSETGQVQHTKYIEFIHRLKESTREILILHKVKNDGRTYSSSEKVIKTEF